MSSDYRLILYHKHPSSGRTLFLRLGETVCQFDGVPATSQVVESQVGGKQVNDSLTTWLTDAEQRLGLMPGVLKTNEEFKVAIADADTSLQIYLIRVTTTDPPEDLLAEQSGKFIAITEARRLPAIELELLRLAYSAIMDDLS